ncbi:MAG: winged helix DNA-binding protein [Atribacterota bacterium]|jgi:DNA-binding MarR family transcriptional regulator|nr:winged helix DNA-binding protein [Atribacterota bacterium]MDD3641581.1 winged helix DNA-binding protein [Atribacterota bacterium]MDD4289490.1 winged helix DNA-binding protein [Atribacterota bacterium]MDD4764845.1 winged helix DNA-binding protein [Atribacterota bacterium]MDD5635429.1 winged helix DNA-binding protein [Atribacterota bacterium]
MNKSIAAICSLLEKTAWHFGNHGISEKCCGDLSFTEYIALKIVYKNDQSTIQFIGHALNFTKSGATKIINRLEWKGYVIRKNSLRDGRFCCVSITDKGIAVISRIIENQTIQLENRLKHLTPEKKEDIKITLEILVNALQEHKSLKPALEDDLKGECCC